MKRRACEEVMLGRKIERNSPAQLSRFLASRLGHASENESRMRAAQASLDEDEGSRRMPGSPAELNGERAERVKTREVLGDEAGKGGYGRRPRSSAPAPTVALDVDISGWL